MSKSSLSMLLAAGITTLGFKVVAQRLRKKRVMMKKAMYKSHYVGRLVRKRFHMSDGTTKWFTAQIIRGTVRKCRVMWEDGSSTTICLRNELNEGSINLVREL
jgi:hypothetical protein